MSTITTVDHQPAMTNSVRQESRGEVLVRVENVRKKFCRSLKKSLWYGVKDIANELNPFARQPTAPDEPGSQELRNDEFWAVNDVSFELRRGECLGLIGHNGAGKTTLLKMLNGLIKPDAGRIEMRGRVGALIALGAGFNPILTGRENIYVNASVLGLSRHEIDDKITEIVDFAEIAEFIDSPVQSYSSGMAVRLGFAIATALKPDILLLDEVLAVGDMAFQAKCLERIGKVRQAGAALIFVSHNTHQISNICDRGLVLHRGECVADLDVQHAIHKYTSVLKPKSVGAKETDSWSAPGILIENAGFAGKPNESGGHKIDPHEGFLLELCVLNTNPSPESVFVDVRIEDSLGTLAQCDSRMLNQTLELKPGRNCVEVRGEGISRQSARVTVNIAVWSIATRSIIAWSRGHELNMGTSIYGTGRDAYPLSFNVRRP